MAPVKEGNLKERGLRPIFPTEGGSTDFQLTFDNAQFLSRPSTVVSRPSDDSTNPVTSKRGLEIEIASGESFDSIGARISSSTTGLTRAYLYDVSAGQTIDEADISGLSSGEAFRLNGDLQAGQRYRILADAEGAEYTTGFLSGGGSFPYTGSEFDITAGMGSETDDTASPTQINDIGDVGFN